MNVGERYRLGINSVMKMYRMPLLNLAKNSRESIEHFTYGRQIICTSMFFSQLS